MLPTFPALLRDNKLEWLGDVPAGDSSLPVRVHVTILEPVAHVVARGRLMADALERLAASTPTGLPDDPAAWQREERQERTLKGREG